MRGSTQWSNNESADVCTTKLRWDRQVRQAKNHFSLLRSGVMGCRRRRLRLHQRQMSSEHMPIDRQARISKWSWLDFIQRLFCADGCCATAKSNVHAVFLGIAISHIIYRFTRCIQLDGHLQVRRSFVVYFFKDSWHKQVTQFSEWNFRRDSTIVAPYKKWAYYDPRVKQMKQTQNYAQNKTKKVAWFVSNCGARNGRLSYARELQKHIQVWSRNRNLIECPK